MEEDVTVLLIEDDEAAAEMYRLRLQRDGYTVITASDGEEGLRRAREDHPDLVYLDIRLPKLDGLEVLRQIRASAETAALPVIILSNYGEPDLREKGLQLGVLDYLVKADTTPSQLSEAVERWADTAVAPAD
jgi:two-component system, OmpR family, alkaline phosphatase synthesis response regulator PhoP